MTDSQKGLLYRCIFLTALLLAVYGNTLNHGFVWDDTDIIVGNPLLEKLGNIPMFFLMEDRIETASGYYRPLTYASFTLDRVIWGLNPVGFNITNLLLHIAATLSFYLVVAALFQRERLAFIAALLFSLHPVAGETVNFHSGGRNTLLCAVFFLLALLFHVKKKPLAAVLCLAGAIFSKEFGLVLPAILYVYDRFIKNEKPRPITYAPYLIPIVCYFTLRSFAVEKSNLLESLNFTETLWAAPLLVMRYLLSMINPFGLKVLYDVHTNIYVAVLCLVGALALVAALFYFLKKQQQELALSIFWYLLFLLPVINIIHLPAASFMADRYAYFSLMGFCLALAYLICKARQQVAIAIVLVLCVVYSVIDFRRNGHWKDDFSFYTQMIKDAPEMALGYHDLGIHHFKQDDLANAEKYLAIAASKEDITPRLLGAGAGALWESGKLDAAEKLLLRQLELDPTNPQPYIMLKMVYERKGNLPLSKSYGAKAEAMFPGIEQMMVERVVTVTQQAETFIAQGSHSRATTMLLEALAINPDYVPALIDMASISAETGAAEKALRYLTRAVALDPLNASAQYNLSMLYQMQGRPAEADTAMKKFTELEAIAKQKQGKPGARPDAGPASTGAGQ
ncbi:MAG: hypothetical protein A2075_06285 [Geobacteraceae bacterium GWC2_58_44]|nr:MAG: hypothetical protein A2075_06285 [Geobacteraceae bacterium GWC2_58_44]HBG04286.1 hypothetical protein [Geobacter sp.]